MLDEPPINDKLHVEVLSSSSRIGLLHPKVHYLLVDCSYYGWLMKFPSKCHHFLPMALK
jgi:hypothetical protein